MDVSLIPVLLGSSAPVTLMVPGSVESVPLEPLEMVSSVKMLMRYEKEPSSATNTI